MTTPASCGARPRRPSAIRPGLTWPATAMGIAGLNSWRHEIASDLRQYVPLDASIKISRLLLTNRSNRSRRLSVASYVEWVLGASRSASLAYLSTELDDETGALFAQESLKSGVRVARRLRGFVRRSVGLDMRSARIHRPQWLARRSRRPSRPYGMVEEGRRGSRPLRGMRTSIVLPPGGAVEIIFLLGRGRERQRSAQPDPALPIRRSRFDRSRNRGSLGKHALRRRRQDAHSLHGHHAQWLVAVSDAQ